MRALISIAAVGVATTLFAAFGGIDKGHAAGVREERARVTQDAVTVSYVYGTDPEGFVACVARGNEIGRAPRPFDFPEAKLHDRDVCAETLYRISDWGLRPYLVFLPCVRR